MIPAPPKLTGHPEASESQADPLAFFTSKLNPLSPAMV
jgi:hypothetical protein